MHTKSDVNPRSPLYPVLHDRKNKEAIIKLVSHLLTSLSVHTGDAKMFLFLYPSVLVL